MARNGRGGPGVRGGARRPATSGALHAHQPHTATTVEVSADRRRALVTTTAVETTRPAVPDYHAEDHETARAMEDPDFSYLLGDDGGWAVPPSDPNGTDDDDGIRMAAPPADMPPEMAGHFERWSNADFPMQVFIRDFREETLDEMLRAEGRGAERFHRTCARCKVASPLFRCSRQTCFGPAMYCEACVALQHRQLPTHMLEKWNGEFFEPLPLNELDVEARLQLGHVPGSFCPKATPAHKDFTVIDTLGVHIVKLNFCGCDSTVTHRQQLMRACLWPATSLDPQTCATFNAIKLFEVQNCLGKISAYDFVRSLELLTNNDGLNPTEVFNVQDRRRAFRAIVRQYRMMDMLKRAGRGHEDSGVRGTRQGELALDCRACPQPDKNLPEGWDEINWDEMDEDRRYKYFLFLSQDANFKLINRNVSSEERDPVVDDGAGYFCNRADYSAHIRKHVDEEEISSCSGFQAMFLANAKKVKGLRSTGIGGVTCARHNMWRPNGLGDLQAGERFCNMDFLFFAAVLNFALMWLILSYDIACQFSKNIWKRMPGLPESEYLMDGPQFPSSAPQDRLPLGVLLPLALGRRLHPWRDSGTKLGVFKRRSGRDETDGLGCEGIKEGRAHKTAFEAFTAGLTAAMPEAVAEWKEWVEKWETTRHVENEKSSPYEYAEIKVTLKDIRLKLAKEEYERTGDGEVVGHAETPSNFLSMGMDIEEAQRQLTIDVKAAGPHATPTQQLDMLKRRTQLRARIKAFRKLQQTYMPAVRANLTRSQRVEWDTGGKEPENTRLFMPSDLSTKKQRDKACVKGLDGIEARLRDGEAGEALDALRDGLRTRTATTRFKVRNWSGQRALTRGQGILRLVNLKIHGAKIRYRYTRQALLKLKGHGAWEDRLRVLTEEDVRALNERALNEEEKAERERLREAGEMVEEGGIAVAGDLVSGETHRTLSWIWYAVRKKQAEDEADKEDEKLHEALRVEWCKAYSRSRRWREELVLVEEEMRRTIEYGVWAEGRWEARSSARSVMLGTSVAITPEVAEGVRAYALEQAARERRTCEKLRTDWGPIRGRGADYLSGRDISGREEIVVEVDRDSLRWAEALAYEREEVENDMYQ
ncbi:hypothetical protein C8F04DRAFT_1181827 [Mycena alexandri]|uniref:CxC2-like cysteine cluster KDZ transposase-associated domain-containing protein n=1 Tax=Mycena alexandri TaxID=1745969 RepID=A0AAD6T057_9AGAR|nr:hypothetical protein C8F04DRAFT_1181827 [Mycena alexandri]